MEHGLDVNNLKNTAGSTHHTHKIITCSICDKEKFGVGAIMEKVEGKAHSIVTDQNEENCKKCLKSVNYTVIKTGQDNSIR